MVEAVLEVDAACIASGHFSITALESNREGTTCCVCCLVKELATRTISFETRNSIVSTWWIEFQLRLAPYEPSLAEVAKLA